MEAVCLLSDTVHVPTTGEMVSFKSISKRVWEPPATLWQCGVRVEIRRSHKNDTLIFLSDIYRSVPELQYRDTEWLTKSTVGAQDQCLFFFNRWTNQSYNQRNELWSIQMATINFYRVSSSETVGLYAIEFHWLGFHDQDPKQAALWWGASLLLAAY